MNASILRSGTSALLLLTLPLHAQIQSLPSDPITVMEDFSTHPTDGQWELFGESELFQWNPINENLEVTWDSSRSNSYLRLPLGTILTSHDDFQAALDLTLSDYEAGLHDELQSAMQIAFGFQNAHDASQTNYYRGTGDDSPNLAEFNFFPDTGFGPTVWPAIVSTNSVLNYNGPQDFSVFNLPLDIPMRIELAFDASQAQIQLSIRTNGILVGPVTTARLATNSVSFGQPFTQFHLDAFAIASYSEAGQSPPYGGSLLAHGVIDNCTVTFPAPPIQLEEQGFDGETWQARFLSRANWLYTLQATEGFSDWIDVAEPVLGTGNMMTLEDTHTDSASSRFYRIKANPID